MNNDQMRKHYLLFIEEMIQKEKEHLFVLKTNNAPDLFIKTTESAIGHLKQRHKEYKNYLEE
jgi:uncharacterized protein involved in tolerance to divalent cations